MILLAEGSDALTMLVALISVIGMMGFLPITLSTPLITEVALMLVGRIFFWLTTLPLTVEIAPMLLPGTMAPVPPPPLVTL